VTRQRSKSQQQRINPEESISKNHPHGNCAISRGTASIPTEEIAI
jgi:hypothetical protein